MDDRELQIKLQLHFKLTLSDLPMFSKIDGYLFNNDPYVYNPNPIKYWVERKTRNVTFDAYPDIVVDAAKFFALIEIEDITTVPAILAYGWSCGTWGIARPAKIESFAIESLTPSMNSVSLNKGVGRDVVKIRKEEFELHYAQSNG